jgi:heme exporter protein D
LVLSWLAFALCIIVTVISFRVSIRGHKHRRELLDEIYEKKDRSLAQNLRTSVWSRILTGCTWAALFSFLAALVLTVLFVVKNVSSIGSVPDVKRSEPAAIPCKEVRNYFMNDNDRERKVTVPDFTRGREIPKIVPPPAQKPVTPQREQK